MKLPESNALLLGTVDIWSKGHDILTDELPYRAATCNLIVAVFYEALKTSDHYIISPIGFVAALSLG